MFKRRWSLKNNKPRPSLVRQLTLATDQYYPLFVVPLESALSMKSIEIHENLVEQGVVRRYDTANDGEIIFVSHQWVSATNPCHQGMFDQFGVFQSVIRQLMNGAVVRSGMMHYVRTGKVFEEKNWKKRLANAVVWYDAFCVPQVDKKKLLLAAGSIPAYIELSSMFFVVTPMLYHAEHVDEAGQRLILTDATWKSRGWCRMEGVCRLLARSSGPVVFIHSEKNYEIGPLSDIFFSPVGEGEFGVPCDSVMIGQALAKLVQNLLADFAKSGRNPAEYHFLRAAWSIMFSGLPMPDIVLPDVSADDLPFPLLFYEVVSRNLEGVKKLVKEGADVNAVLAGNFDGGLIGSKYAVGFNVLMMAMCSCRSEQDWPILDYLRASGVDMGYVAPGGHVPMTALTVALGVFNREGAKWFISNVPAGYQWKWSEPSALENYLPDLAEFAVEKGMRLNVISPHTGAGTFFRLAHGGHDAMVSEKLRKLLGKSYADLHQERCKVPSRMKRVLCRVLYRVGSKHRGFTAMALIDGASLLICAVLCHNPSQVRWLVDVVKVPLQAKNKLGMTALDIARVKGYTVIESILLEAEERARGVNSC